MNPYNPGPMPPQGAPIGMGGPPPAGPMPGYAPQGPPRAPLDLGRIAAAVVVVAGLVVLFCSLLNLYTITVSPGKVADDVDGTVEIGVGFYTMVPFNAPVLAMAVPLLMLVAGTTALPGVLGRTQGTLVCAVSAMAATLLSLVLMFVNPLPDVSLTGELAREANDELRRELNVSSVESLIARVVDTGPGAGLIIAFVFGLLASAAAVFLYLRAGAGVGPGAAPMGMPPTFAAQVVPQPGPGMPGAPGPMPGAPHPQQGWGGPVEPR